VSEYVIGRRLARLGRPAALVLVGLAYVAAAGAGVQVARSVHLHPLGAALAGDLAATALIFAISMAVGNSSLYDPYWSVAPPIIAVGWLVVAPSGSAARQSIVVILLAAWAVRLTANWTIGWSGLSHEDWRYVRMRDGTRGTLPWWLVSLTGIQLMPTLVVFAGMLAVWPALTGDRTLNLLDLLAGAVTVVAIGLEGVADVQMRRFVRDPAHRGRVAEVGLWRWTRHPNYLGEISLWWGMWLFGLAAAPDWWWTIAGPLAMVALFVFVSVPLMDRRSRERRPDFDRYAARVPALLPRRPRPH
jgi:steroid 5-alpha reductase family enzyme